MKKVLWVSYVFPPLNCGVGRQVKIAKYLPDYGWLPVVLSAKRSRLRPFYDPPMVKDIPPNVEVHRTLSLESKIIMQYLPYLLRINPKWFHIPDQFIGWLPFAVREGLRIIGRQKIDAIFSTSPPNTCHLVAYVLKRRIGLPWVADFRDLWTQSIYISFPRLVLGVENKMEAAVVRAADRITTINDPMKQDIQRKYSNQPAEKFITIPHGFDPEDFMASNSAKKDSPDRFILTYTGSLYGKRKVDTFVYAIKELIDKDSSINEKLNIRFVGNVSPARRLCNQLGLDRVMTFSGMVTHQEAWEYLSASDVLLFVLGTGDLDEKASTGKLFEYLAVGKPVLALAPEGVASNIIREANVGIVVNPDDKEAIKQTVSKMYARWLSGNLRTSPNKEVIEQYDVGKLAKRFAIIFDELIDRQS